MKWLSWILLGIILILSTSCQSDAVPTTAVSATPSPPSATGTPRPTATASPTAVIPPTATLLPTTTPSPTPSAEQFLEQFVQAINGRLYLQSIFPTAFTPSVFGHYPNLISTEPLNDTFRGLLYITLPHEPAVQIYEIEPAFLAAGLQPEQLFPEEPGSISLFGSSGWGSLGDLNGLIYVISREGALSLGGLILSTDDFVERPLLTTEPVPEGVIFSILENGHQLWHTSSTGSAQQILTASGKMSLNPSQRMVIVGNFGQTQIELIDVATGISEPILLPGRLMHGAEHMVWLDDETAVLQLTEDPSVGQSSVGKSVLFDTASHSFTPLDGSGHYSYTLLSITPQKQILYFSLMRHEFVLWQNDEYQSIPLSAFSDDGFVQQPTASPDGTKIVGVHASSANPYGFYLFDLASMRLQLLHRFRTVPGDSLAIHNTYWSPDGKWIALEPATGSPFERGVWLVAPERHEKQFLGVGSAPVWLNQHELVFTAVYQNKTGLQKYHVNTKTAVWLDTPQFNTPSEKVFNHSSLEIQAIGYDPNRAAIEPLPITDLQSDGWSNSPAISSDGQMIAFVSQGKLTANAGEWGVYVRNMATGTTHLVNKMLDGRGGDLPVYEVAISGNGQFIAFYSADGALVENDVEQCGDETYSYNCEDLFVYDFSRSELMRIPRGRNGGLGSDYSVAISENGRFIAYGNSEYGNNEHQLIIYDRETGVETAVLTTVDGKPPNGSAFAPRFSHNGDLIFVSLADNLVPHDANEYADLFLWDANSRAISLISKGINGEAGNAHSGMSSTGEGFTGQAAFSGNGRFIAYSSLATNLTADDIGMCDDFRGFSRPCHNLFLFDRESGQARLISQNVHGEPANGDSFSPSLSQNGRLLTFASSADNLTTNLPHCQSARTVVTCGHIFVIDLEEGALRLITGIGDAGSWGAQISNNGRYLTFVSIASNLVPQDSNGVADIFHYTFATGELKRINLKNEQSVS